MGVIERLSFLGQLWLAWWRGDPAQAAVVGPRVCRFEEVEPRRLMAADVLVGATYFDPHSGLDTVPNQFEVQFEGGARGTQLTHLRIDGSKDGGPLTFNDAVFDTAAGGLGAYGFSPLSIVSHDGFQVTGAQVVDGGTSLDLYFDGFEAGMKLIFTVDVDQVLFVDPQPGDVQVDAVDEGAEFQRSHLVADFSAPHYQDLSLSTQFWDVYDSNFSSAESQVGATLDLPSDHFTGYTDPPSDQWVYSDGAVAFSAQTPLPASISGVVYYDSQLDNRLDDGDAPLAGVGVALWQFNGDAYAPTGQMTVTDSQGGYHFDNLPPGDYRVVKSTPDGYLDVGASAGSVDGQPRGQVISNDVISAITLAGGEDSVQNDFAEALPNSIAGHVGNDTTGDCDSDGQVPGISGVAIELLDGTGTPIQTTTTDASGNYHFDNLPAGDYTVLKQTPSGWLDEDAHVGSAGSTLEGTSKISHITLGTNVEAAHYDFCEVLPVEISGHVGLETAAAQKASDDLPPLAGVVVQLLDATGRVVDSATTDEHGNYSFSQLPPATYAIGELQPSGYFDGDTEAGSAGGTVSDDLIADIALRSGAGARDYDFSEIAPATLGGLVFQDGPPIMVPSATDVPNVPAVRDGKLTPDDTLLPGVTLELRDGATGQPILGSAALGGIYPAGQPITVVTDQQGAYQFVGLQPGSYAVYLVQPNGYLPGIDTIGSTGGILDSRWIESDPAADAALVDPPGGDAILAIPLATGSTSTMNNFSVVATTVAPPNQPPPVQPFVFPAQPSAAQPALPVPFVTDVAPLTAPLTLPAPFYLMPSVRMTGANLYTWHLSVVDAGQPRALQGGGPAVQFTAVGASDNLAWSEDKLEAGEWIVGLASGGKARRRFGIRGGIPITGDFNGDGKTDLGAFKDGNWYIDLNDNGVWDAGDLWARLGRKGDLPVTGDWDGDGKTDIGTYGPAWAGDPKAIAHEPGLPDPSNENSGPRKNMPREPDRMAAGKREMQLTSTGRQRQDLIDHVFLYGSPGDHPITGDFNGDGIDTVAVFRDGHWQRDVDGDGKASKGDHYLRFGKPGDRPVVGDFNGDGIDDVGVYRNGTWYIDLDGNGAIGRADLVFQLGQAGDVPIVGDFDGDGKDEPGVFREASTRTAAGPAPR